ncbi:MAG: CRISPR-associated protein Cas4 [Desulfurococcaceae archaeon]
MISIKPPGTINPSLVKQYSYCPVLVWLKTWFLLEEPLTDSMVIGKENTRPRDGKGQLYIKTTKGITIIDEVVENKRGSRIIIERKAYGSHNYSRYIEQLVSSYLVAKDKLPGVKSAILEIEGVARKIELGKDLLEDVEKIVEKTRELVAKEKPPPRPPNTRKCASCWYKRYCPYW